MAKVLSNLGRWLESVPEGPWKWPQRRRELKGYALGKYPYRVFADPGPDDSHR